MHNEGSHVALGVANPVHLLDRFVDGGIAATVLVAPLVMGGRFPVGRLLLAVIVGVTAVSWFVSKLLERGPRIFWGWAGAEWIAALAVLLVAAQVVPWPSDTIQWLSPELSKQLPLFYAHGPLLAAMAGEADVSGWSRLSLAPHATRSGLSMVIVYAFLFLVMSQRLRKRQDVERLLKLLATAGVMMATLGLAQYLFGNGKFLWFTEHPSRDTFSVVKGTFVNENHFAHFLALTLGPLIWWLVQEQQKLDAIVQQSRTSFARSTRTLDVRQAARFIAFGIVLVAGLLTYSRGGLAMMMLSATITTGLFVYQRRLGKRAVLGIAAVGAIAALAIWIHGQDVLVREMDTLRAASVESLDQGQSRRKIWAAVLRAIPDFALTGSGVGSHRYVYPTYFSEPSDTQYTHAESGYLQVMLETGGIGLGLLLVGIGLSGSWLVRSLMSARTPHVAALVVPLIASWSVSVVHAIFDFNWYIPANMTLTMFVIAAAGSVRRLAQTRRDVAGWSITKGSWAVMSGATVLLATLSISQLVAPARASYSWHEFRAWTLAAKRFANKTTGAGRQRTLGLVDPTDPNTVASMMSMLGDSLLRDPQNGRGHVRMAALCLQQFELLQARSENRMSLAQIRDAALSSEFPSHEAMVEWVDRVVGTHRAYLDRARWHALQGIMLTPTEGSGYVYLSEVAFLDKDLLGNEHLLLQQAYAVRPFDPSVQFLLGHRKFLEGDGEAAMVLWKDAFRRGPEVRRRIIATIGFETPPQQLLSVFQPNLDGMRDMFDYYRSHRDLAPQARYMGGILAAALEEQAQLISGVAAGPLWFDAQFVHSVLGNRPEAAEAALQAVRVQPTEYRNHLACALRMREAGRFDEALRQLQWCKSRRADREQSLVNLIRAVEQEKLTMVQATTTPMAADEKRF